MTAQNFSLWCSNPSDMPSGAIFPKNFPTLCHQIATKCKGSNHPWTMYKCLCLTFKPFIARFIQTWSCGIEEMTKGLVLSQAGSTVPNMQQTHNKYFLKWQRRKCRYYTDDIMPLSCIKSFNGLSLSIGYSSNFWAQLASCIPASHYYCPGSLSTCLTESLASFTNEPLRTISSLWFFCVPLIGPSRVNSETFLIHFILD